MQSEELVETLLGALNLPAPSRVLMQAVGRCDQRILEAELTHGEDSKERNRAMLYLAMVLCNLADVLAKEVTL